MDQSGEESGHLYQLGETVRAGAVRPALFVQVHQVLHELGPRKPVHLESVAGHHRENQENRRHEVSGRGLQSCGAHPTHDERQVQADRGQGVVDLHVQRHRARVARLVQDRHRQLSLERPVRQSALQRVEPHIPRPAQLPCGPGHLVRGHRADCQGTLGQARPARSRQSQQHYPQRRPPGRNPHAARVHVRTILGELGVHRLH